MDRGVPGSAHRRQLTVDVRSAGPAAVVAPSGEVDHHTADLLSAALNECRDAGCALIVIDCSALEFCDSIGLNVLLTARLHAEAAGGRIHLAAMRPHVARVFEITGAGAVFEIHATLDAALAVLPGETA